MKKPVIHIIFLAVSFLVLGGSTGFVASIFGVTIESWWFVPYLLFFAIGYGIIEWFYRNWKIQTIEKISFNEQIRKLAFPSLKFTKRNIFTLALLPLLAGVYLFIALGNPYRGKTEVSAYKQQSIFTICLDVSNSMDAIHGGVTRLNLAKKVIKQITNNLEGNQFELVIFSDDAFRYIPATNDVNAVNYFLENVSTSFSKSGATSFKSLEDYFSASKDEDFRQNQQIVVISDGEDFQSISFPKGSIVHAIGVGSGERDKIPYYENGKIAGYKTSPSGSTIYTKADPEALKSISNKYNGLHFTVDRPQTNFLKLTRALMRAPDRKEKVDFSAIPNQKHHYFGMAAALSIVSLLIVSLWKRWF